MKKNILGPSDLNASVLCLGTMTFGNEADEMSSHQMLDQFVTAGGNLIDTADVYSQGLSEEFIGRWLVASGKRNQVLIATKARFALTKGAPRGLHPDYLKAAIEGNLRRLGVETIDLFQPHAFDPEVAVAEWLGLIKDLIDQGKIRFLGVSNFLSYQLQETLDVAKYEGLPTVVTLQSQYNLIERRLEYDVMDVCRNHGISLLPWGPLGGGWLTGKYQRDWLPTGETRLGLDPHRGVEAYAKRNNDRVFAILDVVTAVAEEQGASRAQIALAWLAQHPQVGGVILGARSSEQLLDNLDSADVTLSDEQWHRLDEVSRPEMPDYPYGMVDQVKGR